MPSTAESETESKSENAFVVDLLTTLRQEKFSPLGWWHFLARSWQMSWHTAKTHPTLKRSWARVTLLIGVLALGILAANIFFERSQSTLRLLPGFVFCVVWQQLDLFWHLGLNRQPEQGKNLLPIVGIANALTWLRGLGASYLIGRLVGGLSTPDSLALLVFLGCVVTDILDGQIARRTATLSKLGQIADGETDFCLYLSITIILIQNGVLPLWIGLLMLLRFFIPFLAALVSYFLFARPVRFGSTIWGKYAGLAQSSYFFVLLAPPPLAIITHPVNLLLLIITLVLLIIAPVAQIVTNMHKRREAIK